MEQDPIGNDARHTRRERRVGANATCLLCGYAKPEALFHVPGTLLEEHHVGGRANDPRLTVSLCRNCHAEVTEDYKKHGVSMHTPGSVLEQVIASLQGLGAFLLCRLRSIAI